MEYERISPNKKVRIGSKEWKEAKGIKEQLFKIIIEKPSQYPNITDLKFIRVERTGDTITIYFEGKKKPTSQELQAILGYLNNPFQVKTVEEVQ